MLQHCFLDPVSLTLALWRLRCKLPFRPSGRPPPTLVMCGIGLTTATLARLVLAQSPILFWRGKLQVLVTQLASDWSVFTSAWSSVVAATGGTGGAPGTGGTLLGSLFVSLLLSDSGSVSSLVRLLSLDLKSKILSHSSALTLTNPLTWQVVLEVYPGDWGYHSLHHLHHLQIPLGFSAYSGLDADHFVCD